MVERVVSFDVCVQMTASIDWSIVLWGVLVSHGFVIKTKSKLIDFYFTVDCSHLDSNSSPMFGCASASACVNEMCQFISGSFTKWQNWSTLLNCYESVIWTAHSNSNWVKWPTLTNRIYAQAVVHSHWMRRDGKDGWRRQKQQQPSAKTEEEKMPSSEEKNKPSSINSLSWLLSVFYIWWNAFDTTRQPHTHTQTPHQFSERFRSMDSGMRWRADRMKERTRKGTAEEER